MPPPDAKQGDARPSDASARPDMIGRVLSDRYRIDALIATGSFGAVYRGAHLHMRKQVAIKVLHPEIENFPELVERFEREAVAGAHISHPNVAVASDLGKFDGDSYFLVQEYVPGETLREVMNRGPLPAVRAAFIARQIAAGLSAAHRHKIVHRDLKPLNVMLVEDTEDFVKLIDFGFARVPIEELPHVPQDDENPTWAMSEAGVVFGSVAYMAPDAALGMRNVDERSDLYALGVIFYEMLAGKHPFDINLPTAELFERQRHGKPPPLRERNPDTDATAELEAIVMRLLEKAPENRYQDATSVVSAIDGAMRGVPGYLGRRRSDRPPPADAKPAEKPDERKTEASFRGAELSTTAKRHRALGGAIATVGIAAAAIVIILNVSKSKPPTPVASAAPSALAPASVAPPPQPSASVGGEPFERKFARDLKGKFLSQADQEKTDEPSRTWLLMMEADPKAIEDSEVQNKTIELLARADPEEESSKKIVYQLAYKAGSVGLDLLYRLIEESSSSGVALRSEPILYRQLNSDRLSPALRVTLDIRRMNCARKILLFDRAGTDGDARTQRQLDQLRPPNCRIGKGQCCFKDNLKLEKAIAQIEDREKK